MQFFSLLDLGIFLPTPLLLGPDGRFPEIAPGPELARTEKKQPEHFTVSRGSRLKGLTLILSASG